MDRREGITMAVMRRGMDPKDSTWIIGEEEAASWRLCWRVWRVVVVWMLVCCSRRAWILDAGRTGIGMRIILVDL